MQKFNEVDVKTAEARVLNASIRLAQAIGKSAQFWRYKKISEKIVKDQEAQRLFSEFQAVQQMLQMTQSWGRASDKDIEHLERMKNQLFANPTLKEYLESQEDLVGMLKELNDFISENLGFNFANLTKPAGGCC